MSKSNKYIIHWEIDPIEEGTDSINKKTGKIKMIKSSRGAGNGSNGINGSL